MSTPSFGDPAPPPGLHDEQNGVSSGVAQVQERAADAAGQARERARQEVERRAGDLASRADGTAQDLRGVADHLRSQGKDGPARLAEQAADRIAGAGSYLQRSSTDAIIHDTEAFLRRRPWAAIAGGAALGLTASRMLKASSGTRYRSASAGASRQPLAGMPDRSRATTVIQDRTVIEDRMGTTAVRRPVPTVAGGFDDGI